MRSQPGYHDRSKGAEWNRSQPDPALTRQRRTNFFT